MPRCRCFLFVLLCFLLFLLPSFMAFSLKNCTIKNLDNPLNVTVLCDDRKLVAVPDDIPESATALDLSSNKIARINSRDFRGLSKVTYLIMQFNSLAHIEDRSFVDMVSLTELILNFNSLTHLTANVFEGLSNLASLDISFNRIQHFSPLTFTPLVSLQNIKMNSDYLRQISDLVLFLELPKLYEMEAGINNFTSFESGNFAVNKSSLRKLILIVNPLEKFSITSDMFPNLENMYLSNCRPGFQWNVTNKTFLRSLKGLVLGGTDISLETYKQIFETVENVEYLNLGSVTEWLDQDLIDFACRIPALKNLELEFNNINFLKDTVLDSCVKITKLSLYSNKLTGMSQNSLKSLKQLKVLNLHTNLLPKVPVAIRGLSTLITLYLSKNDIGQLGCEDFQGLSRLRRLSLHSNRISKLRGCVFLELPNLLRLNLEHNPIYRLDANFSSSLSNLVFLFMNGNSFKTFERGDFWNMSSLFRLDANSVSQDEVNGFAFEGLSGLNSLIFSPYFLSKDLLAGLHQLETLSINLPGISKSLNSLAQSDPPFQDLISLRKLTVIDHNSFDFTIPPNLLKGLNKLETFIAHKFFEETPHVDTFTYTPNLLRLQITMSNVSDPKPEMFHPIPKLQFLDLSNNMLRSVDFLIKANLSSLKWINLRMNELTIIDENAFQSLPALKYLDLLGNIFMCDCSNVGFIVWVKNNNQTQVLNAYQYKCSFPPSQQGTALLDFNVQSCYMDTSFICFVSTAGLVTLMLLSSFIYHFLRWQLIYAFYLFMAFAYDSKRRNKGAPYRYDAFVSYNVRDEAWVCEEMLPVLEGQQGWKLCLHHRDFQPGKAIVENITDSIYSSKKTICVISRRYLQSEWCSREIQMASFRLFDEQKDVLILLFLEEIPSHQLSPFFRIRKLIRSRTYLSWTQAQIHPGLFWENVRRAMETGERPEDCTNALKSVLNHN